MSDKIVDFEGAKDKAIQRRKDQKEKDLEKQFKKAMGWNTWPKTKKKKGSKGPNKPKGKKR